MFQTAQRSLAAPYAMGLRPALPLYGWVMTPAVGMAVYSTALAGGLGRVQRSWASTTVTARERVQHEFSRWLAGLPSIFGKTWSTVEPLDILTFMESVWVPNHGGTELPNGKGKVAAPSSISGTPVALPCCCTVWESMTLFLFPLPAWLCPCPHLSSRCTNETGINVLPVTAWCPGCYPLPCLQALSPTSALLSS